MNMNSKEFLESNKAFGTYEQFTDQQLVVIHVWMEQYALEKSRIVSDYTFATRLKNFLSNVQVNDPMSEEELEYIDRVADKLLKVQKTTVTDQSEIEYLKNNNII